MQHRRPLHLSAGLFLMTIFALVLPVHAQCNSNDQQEPCFTNNFDILGGRGSLLQDDDIVVNMNIGGKLYGANLLTTNSAITQTNSTRISGEGGGGTSNTVTLQGRLFNVDHDQLLSVAVSNNLSNPQLVLLEGPDSSIPVPNLSILSSPVAPSGSQQLYGASGDFIGSGFDQFVIMEAQQGSLTFQMLAASDPTTTSSGLRVGPAGGPFSNISGAYAVAAGVFTDPQSGALHPTAKLAVLSRSPTNNQGLALTFYQLDSDLNVTQSGNPFTLTLPAGTQAIPSTIAIAAGRFSGGTHDQLAIAYPVFPDNGTYGTVEITTIDFDAQGNPSQQASSNSGLTLTSLTPKTGYYVADYPANIYLAKGKFNWFGAADELGISVGTDGEYGASLGVMSFDSSLNGTTGSPALHLSPRSTFGLAAGRFDSMQNGQTDPNVQLATVYVSCTGIGDCTNNRNYYSTLIYDVDPTTFGISFHSAAPLLPDVLAASYSPDPTRGNLAVSFVAGDEQGRSLRLGPPEKVSIPSHVQPDTILGLPPMHADWISNSSSIPPSIVNFSVFPAALNASYSFSSNSTGNVARKQTTSYTLSTKETANEEVSYSVPEVGDANIKSSQALTQLHEGSVAKQYNSYTGVSTSFTASTEFDDVVAATSSQLNVYTYPVIGQCVSGSNTSGTCTPLYVQISAPDNVYYIQAVNGANVEWYQPVQEPGNLFSYPATFMQLQSNVGGGTTLQALSPTNSTWDPQSNTGASINWAQGNTANVSSGSTSTHSFDTSVSASGNTSLFGADVSVGLAFDYNSSNSLATLNESSSTFDSSQGIKLVTGASNPNIASYSDYQGQTIIYGQSNPGTIQTDAVPATTVQAQGFIAAAHLADMLSVGPGIASGTYWKQAYSHNPDIALNHPARWTEKVPSGVNAQEIQFNCPYGFTSELSVSGSPCTAATPASPAPLGIADDSFYQMKGLFVTPGNTLSGPQITSTPLGSKVNLRARVYNYSLANYPSGSTLHVQFYAQPWDAGAAQFVAGANGAAFAPAIFIGNGTTESGTALAPPPAFCGGAQDEAVDPCMTAPGSATNNWEFACTTWDTSNLTANSTWIFWVVAWVENNGQLVAELPGHGLQSLPVANVQYNSLADVPIETYSNNLGFYNQPFLVTAAPNTSVGAAKSRRLALGSAATRNHAPVLRDVPTSIFVPHTASGDHIDSIQSLYYDGDPDHGGQLFDTQQISQVKGGSTYLDRALYTARTCGEHEIFVRSIPMDGSSPVVTTRTTFKVTSNPVTSLNDLIRYVGGPPYPSQFRDATIAYFNVAKHAFADKQTTVGAIEMKVLLLFIQDNPTFVSPTVRQALEDQIQDLLGCL